MKAKGKSYERYLLIEKISEINGLKSLNNRSNKSFQITFSVHIHACGASVRRGKISNHTVKYGGPMRLPNDKRFFYHRQKNRIGRNYPTPPTYKIKKWHNAKRGVEYVLQ